MIARRSTLCYAAMCQLAVSAGAMAAIPVHVVKSYEPIHAAVIRDDVDLKAGSSAYYVATGPKYARTSAHLRASAYDVVETGWPEYPYRACTTICLDCRATRECSTMEAMRSAPFTRRFVEYHREVRLWSKRARRWEEHGSTPCFAQRPDVRSVRQFMKWERLVAISNLDVLRYANGNWHRATERLVNAAYGLTGGKSTGEPHRCIVKGLAVGVRGAPRRTGMMASVAPLTPVGKPVQTEIEFIWDSPNRTWRMAHQTYYGGGRVPID